jgi:hypothetical protein
VSADAAADFAALLDLGSRKTFDAAEAAFLLVTSELLFLPAIPNHLLSIDILLIRRKNIYENVEQYGKNKRRERARFYLPLRRYN